MASVTRENIGLLNDKLTVAVQKDDYYPQFEQSLKKYAKTANIPGFRKGMVPSGLLKKMYGQGVFSEEVIRKVEAELNAYLQQEKLDIFAQPLPVDTDAEKLDMNQPGEYRFSFEIGLKPAIQIDPKNIKVTRYKITVTDAMVQEELERLQNRNGKMTEPETVENEDCILNLHFTELDESGNEKEAGISKDDSLLVKYFAPGVRTQWMGKQKDESLVFSLQEAFEEKEREVLLTDLGLGPDDA
ncbi:MAG TPA: trigger factor family protein, partial [Sediminibacterium sp.]|nr:trigger factor family protein [Sediminibacterium sp.]